MNGDAITESTVLTTDISVYAHWLPIYAVTYNANGGENAPEDQQKHTDIALKLREELPTRSAKITYDANGGSCEEESKTVNFVFDKWNTKQDGSGTPYAPEAE